MDFDLKTDNQNLRGYSYNKRRTDRQTEHLVSNPGFLDIWLVLPGLADNWKCNGFRALGKDNDFLTPPSRQQPPILEISSLNK